MGRLTYPEVWHLDDLGGFKCGFNGSSNDSIHRWAEDPWALHRWRVEGLLDGGCTTRWVIVEPRPHWRHREGVMSESDAEAFLRVRRGLSMIGVTLLDAMIFDDENHWWSLHELTTGSLDWPGATGPGR